MRDILEGLAISARYPAASACANGGAAASASELSAAREEQSDVEEKRRVGRGAGLGFRRVSSFLLKRSVSSLLWGELLPAQCMTAATACPVHDGSYCLPSA